MGSENDMPPAGSGHDDETQSLHASEPPPDEWIGPYQLVRQLGEGGMGVVYHARQHHPIRRDVALKVIKPGMDSRQVILRFESERQALALMDHPNIARVFDAGSTAQGLPYFVMELVDGVPITRHCDARRLTIVERIEVFIPVCQAIQHAHQKGIIHRDIKPSNILVSRQEDRAVPKAIDFGLAKALGGHLGDATMMTNVGTVVGTLDYMSPEQAELGRQDVDTRSDVYSLGAVLYELLTGTTPLGQERLAKASYPEALQRIRDEEPKPPSARLRHSGEQESVALLRQADPAKLPKLLRQDLDWIAMRALEKDRSRRYQTVAEFLADLTRHLRHEPVLASPPGSAYRIAKFVRRHRAGVAFSTLLVLALLAGITGTTINLTRALKAERIATEELKTSQAVTDFMINIFHVSDPSEARGKSITVREILERGAERVNRDLASQPSVRSRMLFSIGRVHGNLGLYNAAAQVLRDALEIARKLYGEGHPTVATYALELAWLYRRQGRLDEAEALSRKALGIREQSSGGDSKETASALRMLGLVLRDRGSYGEAEKSLRQSLQMFERSSGSDSEDVASNLYHLGWLKKLTSNLKEARSYYERALPIYERRLGPDHPFVAWCLNDLSVVLGDMGFREEERKLLQRSLDIKVKIQGPEHPDVAAAWNNMGVLLWRMKDFPAAKSAYERALFIREKTLGPEHADVAATLDNLGLLYEDMGELEQALRFYRRALRVQEKALGQDHAAVATICSNLAFLLEKFRRFEEARLNYERALSINRQAFGPEHAEVATVLQSMAEMESKRGAWSHAEPLFQRALEIREKALEPGSPDLRATMRGYAVVLRKVGRAAEAGKLEARANEVADNPPPKAASR